MIILKARVIDFLNFQCEIFTKMKLSNAHRKTDDIRRCISKNKLYLMIKGTGRCWWTPSSSARTAQRPTQIPWFSCGRARHSQTFNNDAIPFAAWAISNALRLRTQKHVAYRIYMKMKIHFSIMFVQIKLFRWYSVFHLIF